MAAICLRTPVIASGDYETTTLRFIDLEGRENARITHSGYAGEIAWSPDGAYVVTVFTTGATASLTATSSDGATQKELLEHEGGTFVLLAGWLPSGELLAEKSVPSGGDAQLLAFDVEAGTSGQLSDLTAFVDYFGRPAISPDKSKLAILAESRDKCGLDSMSNGIVWTIDLQTGAATQITTGEHCGSGGLVWSPDGTQIAFSALDPVATSGVSVVDGATLQVRQLTTGLDNVVAWLDDGTILAQQYACVQCDGGGPPKVLAIDSASGLVREVTGKVPTAVSPSGDRVAVADQEIAIIGLDGQKQATLAVVEDGWSYFGLRWSDDEQHVAYTSSRSVGRWVFEVNRDGSDFRATGNYDYGTQLSPDGKRIAYTKPGQQEKENTTWLANADGTAEQQLPIPYPTGFSWSPDSRKLLIGSDPAWMVSADGSDLQRIDELHAEKSLGPAIWSPDGKHIALLGDSLTVLDVGSGELRTLTTEAQHDLPSWTADSSKIAYIRVTEGGTDVYTVNTDGGGQTRITTDRGHKSGAAISPDGSKVAFNVPTLGSNQLVVFDIDSGERTTVLEGGLLGSTWAWSPDGQWLAIAMDTDAGSGLFVVRPDGSGLTQLTRGGSFVSIQWLDNGRLRLVTEIQGL